MDNLNRLFHSKLKEKIIFVVSVLFSVSAFSSNITASQPNTETRFVAGGNGQSDILVKTTQNAQNISFNHFDKFDLFGNSLTIYNGSILSNGKHSEDSAKVIVIEADSINLAEEIKVIGAPADILIISPNNITCTQCRFVNAGRVTIVNGAYSSNSYIGNINTSR